MQINDSVSVILSRIEGAINLGSIARVMKNFNTDALILQQPKIAPTNQESLDFASHAHDILENAKVINSLQELDGITIAFSRRCGQYRRQDFSLQELKIFLSEKLSTDNTQKINLLFGNESSGLSDQEISIADYICYIPTHETQPSLNLSHSVGIVLYELSSLEICSNPYSTITEINNCTQEFSKILALLDLFDNDHKKILFDKYLNKIFSRGVRNKEDVIVLQNLFHRMHGIIMRNFQNKKNT